MPGEELQAERTDEDPRLLHRLKEVRESPSS